MAQLEKFTRKSQQALAAAKELAEMRDQKVIEPEHLLYALLTDAEGVVFPVVQRIGLSPRSLRDQVEELLGRLPKVYGAAAEAGASKAFVEVLDAAQREAAALKDDYTSAEHLLIALAESKGGVGNLLRREGVTKDSILRVLVEVRGSQRVTSPDPESTYQA